MPVCPMQIIEEELGALVEIVLAFWMGIEGAIVTNQDHAYLSKKIRGCGSYPSTTSCGYVILCQEDWAKYPHIVWYPCSTFYSLSQRR